MCKWIMTVEAEDGNKGGNFFDGFGGGRVLKSCLLVKMQGLGTDTVEGVEINVKHKQTRKVDSRLIIWTHIDQIIMEAILSIIFG